MAPEIVRKLVGGKWRTVEQNASPNGGSQTVNAVDYVFTEVATAGVYTAPSFDIPENGFLIDVQWWLTGNQWAADTAVLDVVDSALGPLVSAADVQGGALTPYNPVSAVETTAFKEPYLFPSLSQIEGAGGGTITTTITTTIAVPPVAPSAAMIVRLFYVVPPTPKPAVFA